MEASILTRSAYGTVNSQPVAHLKLRSSEYISYCGKTITGDIPKGGWKDARGYHTGQHCYTCDRQYRKVNDSYAVCYEF
jgi:hypothetical protein